MGHKNKTLMNLTAIILRLLLGSSGHLGTRMSLSLLISVLVLMSLSN